MSPRTKAPITARAPRLFARLRHRQLESAMSGRIEVSARYARFASRVRQAAGDVLGARVAV
jgi:hypothetical protein